MTTPLPGSGMDSKRHEDTDLCEHLLRQYRAMQDVSTRTMKAMSEIIRDRPHQAQEVLQMHAAEFLQWSLPLLLLGNHASDLRRAGAQVLAFMLTHPPLWAAVSSTPEVVLDKVLQGCASGEKEVRSTCIWVVARVITEGDQSRPLVLEKLGGEDLVLVLLQSCAVGEDYDEDIVRAAMKLAALSTDITDVVTRTSPPPSLSPKEVPHIRLLLYRLPLIHDEDLLISVMRLVLANKSLEGLEDVQVNVAGLLNKLWGARDVELMSLLLDVLAMYSESHSFDGLDAIQVVLPAVKSLLEQGVALCSAVVNQLLPRLACVMCDEDMPVLLDLVELLTTSMEAGGRVLCWWKRTARKPDRHRHIEGELSQRQWKRWGPLIPLLLASPRSCAPLKHPRVLQHLRLSLSTPKGEQNALQYSCQYVHEQLEEYNCPLDDLQDAAEYLWEKSTVDDMIDQARTGQGTNRRREEQHVLGTLRLLYSKLKKPLSKQEALGQKFVELVSEWLREFRSLKRKDKELLLWCLQVLPKSMDINIEGTDLHRLMGGGQGLEVVQNLVCRQPELLRTLSDEQLGDLVKVVLPLLTHTAPGLSHHLVLTAAICSMNTPNDSGASVNQVVWLPAVEAFQPSSDRMITHCQLVVLRQVMKLNPLTVARHPVMNEFVKLLGGFRRVPDDDISRELGEDLRGLASWTFHQARPLTTRDSVQVFLDIIMALLDSPQSSVMTASHKYCGIVTRMLKGLLEGDEDQGREKRRAIASNAVVKTEAL